MHRGTLPLPAGFELCPYCPDGHRLRWHGGYQRYAVSAKREDRVWIRRLLCATHGRTVSLLPDFLLPRKQHVWDVIAAFFHAFAWLGLSLAASMRKAIPSAASRQKAWYWCHSLLRQRTTIRTYLREACRGAAPARPRGLRPAVTALLAPLLRTDRSYAHDWPEHSRRMHARHGRTLLWCNRRADRPRTRHG